MKWEKFYLFHKHTCIILYQSKSLLLSKPSPQVTINKCNLTLALINMNRQTANLSLQAIRITVSTSGCHSHLRRPICIILPSGRERGQSLIKQG